MGFVWKGYTSYSRFFYFVQRIRFILVGTWESELFFILLASIIAAALYLRTPPPIFCLLSILNFGTVPLLLHSLVKDAAVPPEEEKGLEGFLSSGTNKLSTDLCTVQSH